MDVRFGVVRRGSGVDMESVGAGSDEQSWVEYLQRNCTKGDMRKEAGGHERRARHFHGVCDE